MSKPYNYQCYFCGNGYNNKNDCIKHIKRLHHKGVMVVYYNID